MPFVTRAAPVSTDTNRKVTMTSLSTSRRPLQSVTLVAVLTAIVAVILGAPPAFANAPGTSYYSPTSSNEVLSYNRMVRLQHSGTANGAIIGTFEHATLDGSAAQFDIRRSTDDGQTWSTISTLSDPLTGLGHPADHMWEPYLFEFPTALGGYPAGTLMMVADVEPTTGAANTNFVEWRSTNSGASWTYVSNFQNGGAPGSGIWEPFLAVDSTGHLVCYFSDERQNGTYSQKLAHIVSTDGGLTWSANQDGSTRVSPGEVNDVASSTQSDRPGMATIAQNNAGLYVLSFEVCGPAGGCQAHIKTSTTADSWGSGPTDLGAAVFTTDGRSLYHSPFITWSPAGGSNGEFLLAGQNETSGSENQQVIFVNTHNAAGAWTWIPAPLAATGTPTSNCDVNYSPDLLASTSGESVRYTTASAIGNYGCEEVTGQTNAGVLPFSSTFAGGDSGWIDYGGCWTTSAGQYVESCGGNNGNKAIAGSTGWTDYTLSGDVQINSGTQAGFTIRVTNPSTGTDAFNGYYVNVTTAQLALARENGAWTPLQNIAIPGGLNLNSWYHITIQAIGCTLTISGQPVGSTSTPISFTYTDNGCTFGSGAIGVRDQGSTASWRNITVTPGGTTTTTTAPYLAPFASGSTAGWTPYGGNWATTTASETYTNTTGGSGEKSIAGTPSWTNYTLSGDVQLNTTTGASPNAGLLARVTNPAAGVDSLDGYYAGINSTTLILGKESYGWTVLTTAQLPTTIASNTWYHLTIEVVNCQITATAQPSAGGDQISVTYNDAGCTFTNGAVGTRTFSTTSSWRNITTTPR